MAVTQAPRRPATLFPVAPAAGRRAGATDRVAGLLEPGLLVALALAVAYAILFTTVSVLRYQSFHGGGDTADYAQMLWNTIHGRLLEKTDLYSTRIYTASLGLRGGHAEPLLLVLALPYALWPDPRTMLVLQSLALASGGPLIYLLARLHGHRQATAVGLAALYLVCPLVHYANIWDFHPDPFAVPALLGALLAFDLRRWKLLALCLAVILLTKEQMVLFVVGLGAYWWLGRGARRVGCLTIGAALLYALAVLLPWYLATAGQFGHDYGSYFSDARQVVQGSGAATGLGARLQALGALFGQDFRYQNLIFALLPSGLLFLLDSSALIVVLPLAGLFVSNRFTNDFWFHHYVTAVPIFLYGTSRALLRPALLRRSGFLTVLLVAWALLLGYIYAYAPNNMMHWVHQPTAFAMDEHARAQAAFISAVPADEALDADSALGVHLANRTYMYQIQDPRQPSLVPYTVLDVHADMADAPDWLVLNDRRTLAYIQARPGFRLLAADRRHGLYLYANCARFPTARGCSGGAVAGRHPAAVR